MKRPKDLILNPRAPWEPDDLDRCRHGKALELLIESVTGPLAIAVKAPYGAGKTTFLRRFEIHLEQAGIPAVHLDAWRHDFMQDPLLAYIGALNERLSRITTVNLKRKVDSLISGLAKAGGKLCGPVLGTIAKTLVPCGEAIALVAEAVTKSADYLLTEQKEHTAEVKKFRKTLMQARDVLTKRSKNGPVIPLVFVIDELDRCRPDFAIKALERIKHFFDVDGVIFLIATDPTNLPAAVAAVYGSTYDAERYLRKFIDYEFHLPEPTPRQFISYLAAEFSLTDLIPPNKNNEVLRKEYAEPRQKWCTGFHIVEIESFFPVMAEALQLTLRDQVQAFAMLSATLRSAVPGFPILTRLLIVCVCMRFAAPNLYQKLRDGMVSMRVIISGNEYDKEYPRMPWFRNAIKSDKAVAAYFEAALHAINESNTLARTNYLENLLQGSLPHNAIPDIAHLSALFDPGFACKGEHWYITSLVSLADSWGPAKTEHHEYDIRVTPDAPRADR